MKILVRGTNWIGDAIMSIPALRWLREIFPGDHITLHTRSWAEGLFEDASFIDEIVPFDPHKWKLKDALDNSDFLRDDGYELAILLPNSFESALTTYLTRVPRRIGYNKDLRGLLLTDPIPVPEWKSRRHEVYYYLNLISEVEKRVLGRNSLENEPDGRLEVADERKAAAREMLREAGVRRDSKVIAIGAGSANFPGKRWPPEDYAAVADKLAGENSQIILLGSKDEGEVARAVAEVSKDSLIDLSGKTTLDQAVAILSVSDLLISNDTGLAHVAPAVGTPTVVIFGPTNPETTRPFGERALVLANEGGWPSVDDVFRAAIEQLSDDEAE